MVESFVQFFFFFFFFFNFLIDNLLWVSCFTVFVSGWFGVFGLKLSSPVRNTNWILNIFLFWGKDWLVWKPTPLLYKVGFWIPTSKRHFYKACWWLAYASLGPHSRIIVGDLEIAVKINKKEEPLVNLSLLYCLIIFKCGEEGRQGMVFDYCCDFILFWHLNWDVVGVWLMHTSCFSFSYAIDWLTLFSVMKLPDTVR